MPLNDNCSPFDKVMHIKNTPKLPNAFVSPKPSAALALAQATAAGTDPRERRSRILLVRECKAMFLFATILFRGCSQIFWVQSTE